jgi:hypothetical protein
MIVEVIKYKLKSFLILYLERIEGVQPVWITNPFKLRYRLQICNEVIFYRLPAGFPFVF